ncbi:MAG: GDP-mannose 4,6-dehydratase [Sedimentisphaerales bacterium]|nr:GDP-mannose 4,6-dehydratase [Sedimentisphaerales bacterium]
MKALITGGAGFIGSHLAERLLEQGHEVAALDDLSTGSLDNLEHLQGHPRFHFIYDSVRNGQTMHLLGQQADVIFHLAAAVGVQLIVDDPVHTIETNIHGTEVVLSIANTYRKKVLLASTSEVYGKSEAVPFREDDDCILGSTRFARWSYACSKAIDEFLGLAYYEQYGLPVVVARFFNTVGPRQTGRYGMVVPRFVERALKNEPLVIYGSGKQTRCFACVADVVSACIGLMDAAQAAGRVYNVGSDEEISIEDLADTVIEMTGSASAKEFLSYEQAYGKPFDDMMRRVPCLDRIRQTIDISPPTRLEETLRLVIDDIRRRLDAPGR